MTNKKSYGKINDKLIEIGKEIKVFLENKVTQMYKNNVFLRIIGKSSINFEELEKNIPLDFEKHKKGEVLRKILKVENDTAVLTLDFYEEELEKKIDRLLNELHPYKKYLNKISKCYDIILRVYIESNYAQMYQFLSKEILFKIAEFPFDLEISVFSEGKV